MITKIIVLISAILSLMSFYITIQITTNSIGIFIWITLDKSGN